jgi:hypothetical protein
MHKHLAIVSVFQFAISDAIAGWFSELHDWNEARKHRKTGGKRADTALELAQILYDIGEIRPPGLSIWDNNPYRLLIDGMMNRASSNSESG